MSIAAPFLALPVTLLVIRALLRWPRASARLSAAPSADRWHSTTTPIFGGVGIFAGVAAAVGAALLFGGIASTGEVAAILGGCAILFLAGLVDDVRALNPFAKLGLQVIAAAVVLSSGISVEVVEHAALAWALGIAWLVGITNAFNLLDNMDGLAASMGLVASGFFAIAAATVNPNRDIFVVSAAVALACAGFLPFNLRPGRPAAVFMGDSGSQVIGLALGALGLAATYKVAGTTLATLVLPLLVLAVPMLDTGLVTVLRLLEGRPVSQGGRDHTSHRLVYRGLSEKRAVLLLTAIAAGLGATSLAYMVLDNGRITVVGVLLSFALLLQFASFLSDVQQGDEAAVRPYRVHWRRLVEVVVDGALVTTAFYVAYLIDVEGNGTINQRHLFIVTLPILLAARFLTFVPFGLYRSVWRYAGARDAVSVVAAVALSEVVAFAVIDATREFGDFPTSIFVTDALLCALLVGAARFGERAFAVLMAGIAGRGQQRRVLIVGAGRSGRSLLRELRETPNERVVGFVDDDARLRGRRIHGVRVGGTSNEIASVLQRTRAGTVVVTIPEAPADRLTAIVAACERADVPVTFVQRRFTESPPALAEAPLR
ncbi:MAG: NAD-binding protein [Actinobacteria bacterium]|nr:NAD-binding protein [Actinomycetota bacterium]